MTADPTRAPDDGAPESAAADVDTRMIKGSAWIALSYGGSSILSVVSMLVLVRLLEPQAFGLVALASVFLLVLEHVQSAGMGVALVYRRGEREPAASSAFVFSAAAGILLAVVAIAAAPIYAWAVGSPDVADVLRLLALLLAIRGFGVVPAAIVEQELKFRSRAKVELTGAAVQVTCAVGLAAAGAGVWAMVSGQLVAAAVSVLIYWRIVDWRPSFRLANWQDIRELGRYGRHVTAGNILGLINGSVDSIAIARVLGSTAVGLYVVVYRIADYPTGVIGYVVSRVMFPLYASIQDDVKAFKSAFVQTLQRLALFSLPASVFLIVAAEPMIRGLVGDRWLTTTNALRILAVYGVVRVFASSCGAVFQAAGKPHLVPLLALPQGILIIPALVLFVPMFGVSGAALAVLIAFCASGVPAFVVALRLMRVRPFELVRALGPTAAASGVLAAVLAILVPATNHLPPVAALVTLVAAGTVTYAAAVIVLARSAVEPLWLVVRPMIHRAG